MGLVSENCLFNVGQKPECVTALTGKTQFECARMCIPSGGVLTEKYLIPSTFFLWDTHCKSNCGTMYSGTKGPDLLFRPMEHAAMSGQETKYRNTNSGLNWF